MIPLRRVVCSSLIFLALSSIGCLAKLTLHAKPTTLQNAVFVRIYEAEVSNGRLYVKMWLQNTSETPINVDRNGFQLRLPSGEVLARAIGTFTRHNIYSIAPGMGHDVFVDFQSASDLRQITGATLIVGGIAFGVDPNPRVVGEIPLTLYPEAGAPAVPTPTPTAQEAQPAVPGAAPPPEASGGPTEASGGPSP